MANIIPLADRILKASKVILMILICCLIVETGFLMPRFITHIHNIEIHLERIKNSIASQGNDGT